MKNDYVDSILDILLKNSPYTKQALVIQNLKTSLMRMNARDLSVLKMHLNFMDEEIHDHE